MRIGLVVDQVDAQPVVEEPPFQPRFEGVGHLRFEVGAGGGVGGIDAPAGRNVRFGVGDEHGDVVPHAAPCQANLGERNPPGQLEHLADHPRCACRIIEEPAAFVGGVGERRCPVVASRNLEIEAPGILERRRGEKRLRLAPRIDLFVDIGRTVHDDIGDVEHVGEIERRRLGIYTQRIDRPVVQPRTCGRAELPVRGEAFVEHRQQFAVEQGFRVAALDIAPVGTGQRRRRRSIEFLPHLVIHIVHIAARLEPQPAVHLPVGGKRGHDPVAQAPAADAVDNPVGVLLEIVARGDPILDIEFAAGVIDLEMLPVRRDIHPAGEAVKPDQRVHVETARHGFVLDHLAHETDIPVEFEPLPEKPGRGAQVEVMAHQAVRTRDPPLGRIGIGKIVLHLFRPGGDRDRIHRRDPRPEKVARIVVGLHPRTGAPAFHPAAHPVAVLERRQAERGLEREVRGECHGLLFAGIALFGRNEDHAVGGLAAVQGGGRGTLEDRDALDILGIEIRDAVAAVAVPGIGHTAYGRVGLLGGRIENGHTVDHIERLVVAGDRPHAADAYLGRSARTRRVLVHLHAGRLARKRQDQVGILHRRELRPPDLIGRIGQVGIVAFEPQRRHDHLGDRLHILLQHDFEFGTGSRPDTLVDIPQTRDIEHGTGQDSDREFAFGKGRDPIRGTPFDNGSPGDGIARFIGDTAVDNHLPGRGLGMRCHVRQQAQAGKQGRHALPSPVQRPQFSQTIRKRHHYYGTIKYKIIKIGI